MELRQSRDAGEQLSSAINTVLRRRKSGNRTDCTRLFPFPVVGTSAILLLLLLLDEGIPICGYSDGAPRSACRHLRPNHVPKSDPRDPTVFPNPFQLHVVNSEDSSTYDSGDVIRLRIEKAPGDEDGFSGFILQGRDANGTTRGTFDVAASSKGVYVFQCQSPDDTVTHDKADVKRSIEVVWHPPSNCAETPVYFVGTVTRDSSTYWMNWNVTLSPRNPQRCVSSPDMNTAESAHIESAAAAKGDEL